MRLTCLVNRAVDPAAVAPPADDARPFHHALPGYRPTPLRGLPALAAELGLGTVDVKDESDRLGLPAFKVLGAAWAVERTLRARSGVETLVAASAGNHGRAVARVARQRGLGCHVFLPARSLRLPREAIAAEGADVEVVAGDYEDAVARARAAGRAPGSAEIADVGDSDTARWVIDGYATLFAEEAASGRCDAILVPVGVGSLAAAAARFGARAGVRVIGVEPERAACLTASLRAGRPTRVPTPGTAMAGLDCAEVSPAAWPSLRDGILGTVTVAEADVERAMDELAAVGLAIGPSGAASLAGLRRLADRGCSPLRAAAGLGPRSRVLLVATEGPTGGERPTGVAAPAPAAQA